MQEQLAQLAASARVLRHSLAGLIGADLAADDRALAPGYTEALERLR